MISTIIIDDEQKSRETIADILDLYCKDVSVVAQAEDVKSGLNAIAQYKPDVILLDVKMPDGTGFDLLQQLDTIDFKVIFITGYEEYAIKALKFSALDYILKPVDPDELTTALNKAEHSLERENISLKLNAFVTNIGNIVKEVKKIVLKTADNIYVINVQDIIRCKSDRNYTQFYFNDGKKLLVSRTLKEYDDLLNGYSFFRVHQSHLINLNYIDHYAKGDGGFVFMKDGSSVAVSFRKKEQLLKLLEEL
ncbi:response regulator transcription factor [Bacteroidales bacterium AH-315-I05]|nr:response regulator transcription factor [Bacteroidia bacterium]MBN4062421.1 response regulator transcription factor [Bacteroidales bacterium AH-315-I05]